MILFQTGIRLVLLLIVEIKSTLRKETSKHTSIRSWATHIEVVPSGIQFLYQYHIRLHYSHPIAFKSGKHFGVSEQQI